MVVGTCCIGIFAVSVEGNVPTRLGGLGRWHGGYEGNLREGLVCVRGILQRGVFSQCSQQRFKSLLPSTLTAFRF